MTKTFTQTLAHSRGQSLRAGLASVLVASALMAVAGGAQADVFGGGTAARNAQTAVLLDRLTALERELKELKEKGGSAAASTPGSAQAGAPGNPAKPKLKLTAPPGLEGLPGGGAEERERLLVEKELTHEVIGTVNGMLVVRDGAKRFVMNRAEFKAFEKKKREQVVYKMKVEAVTEGGARVTFPDLVPPPPPPPLPTEGASELSQAAQVVDQAKAIEANGGKPPQSKPTPLYGKNKPASPVKKN